MLTIILNGILFPILVGVVLYYLPVLECTIDKYIQYLKTRKHVYVRQHGPGDPRFHVQRTGELVQKTFSGGWKYFTLTDMPHCKLYIDYDLVLNLESFLKTRGFTYRIFDKADITVEWDRFYSPRYRYIDLNLFDEKG